MSYPINYPTPQNANVQIFSEGGTTTDWVKPQGCSFVWFTLIGAGGNGVGGTTSAGGTGGGSGTIVNCLMPSFLIPDVLRVYVATSGGSPATTVSYQQKATTAYVVLQANTNPVGNTNSNFFSAAGLFQSTAGLSGISPGFNATTPTTTFLQAGAGGASTTAGSGGSNQTVYGYPVSSSAASGTTGTKGQDGFFYQSPVLVGRGGAGGGGGTTSTGGNGGNGGLGCGGGGGGICTTGTSNGGAGGNGLVVIISW